MITSDPSVQPEPAQRAAGDGTAAQRREMKFNLHHADLRTVEQTLRLRLKEVAFGSAAVSRVNSIYYDDTAFSSCAESLAGVSRRTKIRLRWYDRPEPGGLAHFEIKHRAGELVRKARTLIRLPEGIEQHEEIARAIAATVDDRAAAWFHLRPLPTALVCYRRRHFFHRPSGIRITLDWDITGYDQLGKRKFERRFPVRAEGAAVIEVKVPAGSESAVPRLLHPLRLRLSKRSKYVQCCARMGYCPAAEID